MLFKALITYVNTLYYRCDSNVTEICLEGYSEDTNCTKGKFYTDRLALSYIL